MSVDMDTRSENRLYGPNRAMLVRAKTIADVLKKTNVLQNGEYNYTTEKLKTDVWQTSTDRDFLGQCIDHNIAKPTVNQLDHHFRLGNRSGTQLPAQTYQGSTMKDDFNRKDQSKTQIYELDRTVNWPDMAPRYRSDVLVKQSEYDKSFTSTCGTVSAPTYPRINTSKLKLPLEHERFQLKGQSHFNFGNDGRRNITEQQMAYSLNADGDFSDKVSQSSQAKDVIRKMKDLERTSHVFREGDYNGHTNSYLSINEGDYGPRTRPPAEILASEIFQESLKNTNSASDKKSSVVPLHNIPNQLIHYAQAVTVPMIKRDGNQVRDDQKNTHFKFGTNVDRINSVYGKDFEPTATVKPNFYVPPSAGKLLQNDPDFSKFGTSSYNVDFMSAVKPKHVADGEKMNFLKKVAHCRVDNVIPSAEVNTHDRQISLSHADFKAPPATFKAMKPIKDSIPTSNFLQTNDALPYANINIPQISETKNHYYGSFKKACSNTVDKIRQDEHETKRRAYEAQHTTHFVVGNTNSDFVSETKKRFDGRKGNLQSIAPAGIVEGVPELKYGQYNMSENQQDLRAGDPHEPSSKESLHARYNYKEAVAETPFSASVMKSDYPSFTKRRINPDQRRMLEKYDILCSKPVSKSHLFHTDNTGQNLYRSMTMVDFLKPENMTGQKTLAAR